MKTKIFSLSLAGLLAAFSASASMNIDTVFVGDAGNANKGGILGIGSVSYNYYIGTYEVTNAQYAGFLNATAATDKHSLYNTNMNSSTHGGITRAGASGSYTYSVKSGFENKPVNYVSFWDAARFTNWLTSGNTESGVYLLKANTHIEDYANRTVRNTAAWNAGGVAIASEDEWYKAAHYSGSPTGADGDGYWNYATQSNSITTNNANYDNSVGNLTDVGNYSDDASYYGTFDQGGNVYEWNDEFFTPFFRGLLGGSFKSVEDELYAVFGSYPGYDYPTTEESFIGFRVTSLEPIVVPEPSTYAVILGGLGLSIVLLRRNS